MHSHRGTFTLDCIFLYPGKKVRDIETEELIEELQGKVRDFEKQNHMLREKVLVTLIQKKIVEKSCGTCRDNNQSFNFSMTLKLLMTFSKTYLKKSVHLIQWYLKLNERLSFYKIPRT